MTPAILLALTPTQRRLVKESREARQVLDQWFNPRVLAEMQSIGQDGLIHRRGRRRLVTKADAGDDNAVSIGQHVYLARRRLGWTQQALSDNCGIARANIARLELGRHAPEMETLRRVAEALQVSLSWILEAPGRADDAENRTLAEAAIGDWGKELERLDKDGPR